MTTNGRRGRGHPSRRRLGLRADFGQAPLEEAPLGLGPAWDIAGDGSLLVVDLPGHHDGHVGLCFPKRAQPLLYATDVQWLMRAVLEDRAPVDDDESSAEGGRVFRDRAMPPVRHSRRPLDSAT